MQVYPENLVKLNTCIKFRTLRLRTARIEYPSSTRAQAIHRAANHLIDNIRTHGAL